MFNFTGHVIGRLTVLSRNGSSTDNHAAWLCRCACGTLTTVSSHNLRNSTTQSCGCLSRERSSQRATIHGLSKRPEHYVWSQMIDRCHCPTDKDFKNYGGRGITVCVEWLKDFQRFYADMGPRPSPDHSIDRIDNNGPYARDNCRWATRIEQGANQRTNVNYTYNGRTQHLSAWARELGIDAMTLSGRIRRYGWTVERAFTTPARYRSPNKRRK